MYKKIWMRIASRNFLVEHFTWGFGYILLHNKPPKIVNFLNNLNLIIWAFEQDLKEYLY